MSPYGSNCYNLISFRNHPTKGTFERVQEFDDGQQWRGKGNFVIVNNRIVFSKIAFIKRQYLSKDSGWKTIDTSIIQKVIFYKKGNYLIEYGPLKKGEKARHKILFKKNA